MNDDTKKLVSPRSIPSDWNTSVPFIKQAIEQPDPVISTVNGMTGRVGSTDAAGSNIRVVSDNDPRSAALSDFVSWNNIQDANAPIEGKPSGSNISQSAVTQPAAQPEPVEEEYFQVYDVEVPPDVDLESVQALVVYPKIAIQAGVQGKVVVKVLVGKDGRAKRAEADYYDSEMLKDAAIRAVMAASYKPAQQNKQPVDCWMMIPVTFRLK
jgi:TonB family protein